MEQNYNATQGHELGWDDEIQEESSEFILLPGGDYRFTVEKVERARHPGSKKVPPCNKAIVTFRVCGSNGETALITEQYLLYSDLEWKLSELFASVGLKGKKEKVKMRWMEIIGKSGICEVYIDNYHKKTDKEGENTGYSNKIKKLYPSYDQPSLAAPAPSQPAIQSTTYATAPVPSATYFAQAQPVYAPQPNSYPAYPQQGNWKPGNF